MNRPLDIPRADEAERALVAAVFVQPAIHDDVAELVDATDFRQPAYAELWRTLEHMRADRIPIDVIAVVNAIKGKPVIPGNAYAWLAELFTEGGYQVHHAEYYAKLIRNRSIKARLAAVGQDITQAACDPELSHDDCMALAEKRLTEVRDAKADSRMVAVRDAYGTAMAELRDRGKGKPAGMPFGFRDVDRIASLRRGQLWILAARPKKGKSAFALNVGCTTAATHPVLFCSLEMTRQEIVERIICNYAGINSQAVGTGMLTPDQWERAEDIRTQLESWHLFIDDNPSQRVQHIAAKARRLKRRYRGDGLVIVDYLQLIEPDNSRDNRNEQIAKITRSLKTLAMELEWPIMALSQLNRSADGERPRLKHLRDSGAIEQDANSVMFIHRDHDRPSDGEHDVKAEIIIAAQRGGPAGECELIWQGEHFRFVDCPLAEEWKVSEFAR